MDRPSSKPGGVAARARWWNRSSISGAAGASVAVSVRYRITTAFAVVTCALAPAYTVRWRAGPLPTTILEDAILLTVAAFVIESLRGRIVPSLRTGVTWPAVLFLIAGAVSVVVAPDHRAALGLYRAYLIEPMAFFLVLINALPSPRRALAIVGGLAVGAAIAGLANSVVVVLALIHHTYDVVNTPPVVIYNTANATALYLVPLMAFAGAVVLHRTDQRERLAAGAFLLVGAVSVLLSFSRGGYLALGAVAVGLALSHRRRWQLLVGGAVVGAALLLVPLIRHRVATEVNLNDPHNTLVGRTHLWSAAIQMLRDHPIFGAGLSGFATAVAPYWNPYHPDRFTYPHNIVLNFWTETGLLGVFAFGAILVVTFARTWRGWAHGTAPEWRAVHLGVMLALVAVVVHGLVDVPYWKNDLSLEFWALLSLTWVPAALPPKSLQSTQRTPARGAPP